MEGELRFYRTIMIEHAKNMMGLKKDQKLPQSLEKELIRIAELVESTGGHLVSRQVIAVIIAKKKRWR